MMQLPSIATTFTMPRLPLIASACAILLAMVGHGSVALAGSNSLIDPDQANASADDGDTLTKPGDNSVSFDSVDFSLLDPDNPGDVKAKSLAGGSSNAPGATWSRTEMPDGSSAVTVQRNLSPFLDTKVGADMNLANPQPARTPENALSNSAAPRSTGSAWASLTGPGLILWDKTNVEARLNPGDDQGQLKTSISKAMPLWRNQFSLTLRNDYSLTEQALPGVEAASTRSVDIDRTARLGYKDTGTSLIVGQSLSSSDERWLNKFGAEQALPGGVSVTATVRERSDGAADKGIGASFKKTW